MEWWRAEALRPDAENRPSGHPSRSQLIFDRRVIKTTPGCIHTRIISDGGIPPFQLDCKNTRSKQHHKEGRELLRHARSRCRTTLAVLIIGRKLLEMVKKSEKWC